MAAARKVTSQPRSGTPGATLSTTSPLKHVEASSGLLDLHRWSNNCMLVMKLPVYLQRELPRPQRSIRSFVGRGQSSRFKQAAHSPKHSLAAVSDLSTRLTQAHCNDTADCISNSPGTFATCAARRVFAESASSGRRFERRRKKVAAPRSRRGQSETLAHKPTSGRHSIGPTSEHLLLLALERQPAQLRRAKLV